jgi:hypothetical protein
MRYFRFCDRGQEKCGSGQNYKNRDSPYFRVATAGIAFCGYVVPLVSHEGAKEKKKKARSAFLTAWLKLRTTKRIWSYALIVFFSFAPLRETNGTTPAIPNALRRWHTASLNRDSPYFRMQINVTQSTNDVVLAEVSLHPFTGGPMPRSLDRNALRAKRSLFGSLGDINRDAGIRLHYSRDQRQKLLKCRIFAVSPSAALSYRQEAPQKNLTPFLTQQAISLLFLYRVWTLWTYRAQSIEI